MNKNLITYILFGVAIVAAAVTMIVMSNNRTTAAKAQAEAAASEEARAEAEKKIAQANAAAEADKRRAAEASEKAAADNLAAEKLAKETATLKAKEAADTAQAQADAADKAALEAQIAQANREAAKLTAEAARDEKQKAEALAKAEAAKAAAEEAKRQAEAIKSEKIIAEAKLLELQKINFEEFQQSLIEWKQDLEEREAALKPEKTIADLAWAGSMEDMTVDESGNLKKIEKKEYRAENDRSLSSETRALAKASRECKEVEQAVSDTVRSTIIKTLEPLYVQAIKEDRVVDADFYLKSIKSLYPDWKFKAEGVAKEK